MTWKLTNDGLANAMLYQLYLAHCRNLDKPMMDYDEWADYWTQYHMTNRTK